MQFKIIAGIYSKLKTIILRIVAAGVLIKMRLPDGFIDSVRNPSLKQQATIFGIVVSGVTGIGV